MNYGGLAACVLALSVMCTEADAQTVLQVPYDSAVISWASPIDPPPVGSGVTRWYAINCGGDDIRIDLPATSIQVKTVAPTPGGYACTLWAVNHFGKSLPVSVPTFEAGYIPPTPENVRIEVR